MMRGLVILKWSLQISERTSPRQCMVLFCMVLFEATVVFPLAGKNQSTANDDAEMKVLGKLLLTIFVFRGGRTQARIVGGELDRNHGDALSPLRASNGSRQPQTRPRAPIADAQGSTEHDNNWYPTTREGGASLPVESVVVSGGVEHDGRVPRQNASEFRKQNDNRKLETDVKDLEDMLQEIARKDPREWTAADWIVMSLFLSFISWLGCCLLSLCCCGRRGSDVLGCLCLYEICCRDGQDIDRCCDYAMA